MKNLVKVGLPTIALAALISSTAGAATLLTQSTTGNDCTAISVDPAYDACVGFYAGNDSNQQDDLLFTLNDTWGTEWVSLTDSKVEEDNSWSSSLLSATFTDGTSEGSLNFSSSFLTDYGTGYDVAISFKAGNEFSVFRWDADFAPTDTLTFSTPLSGLSHASILVRKAVDAPEPSSLALLGLGLVGIGLSRRRMARK